ncbi:MAG: amidohydrolase family protein [Betaproteobacteria bacterium]|nr:amidohydrolase family protein [Betaproteobacteria bacterium]
MNTPAGVPVEELARAPLCAGPDPDTRNPGFRLPPGSCDCHAHVFGPAARYPYSPKRIYTPPDASASDYRRMLRALGVERAVLVQPSVYGTDNRAMLAALARSGGRMRGVAVVEESVTDAELERMHAAGVRGVRFNIVDVKAEEKGRLPLDVVRKMAERVRPLGWHLQFLMHVDEFPELDKTFANLPVDIVVDHFGYMETSKGVGHPGFKALLRLLRTGRCWVKFTGAYRISREDMPYRDVVPYAHALVAAAPERMVWGTDWPHPKHEKAMPNDGELCDRLPEWIPDEKQRHLALVENPERLYGFR